VAASATSVSLAAAGRATSRTIGYATAAALVALAFLPGFAFLVLTMPPPLVGAVLVFLSCALMVSGVTIMSSRMLDARKTHTLGVAFAFAVATSALTQADALLPDWMAPVVASPLLASALVAMLLNPVLRLGIRQQVALSLPQGGLAGADIGRFVTRAGAAWGARREVIERVKASVAECLDTLADAGLADGPVQLILGFNELHVDARIAWRGRPLRLAAAPPSREALMADEEAVAQMAGYLVRRLATRVSTRSTAGGEELLLVFEH
jgi:NCS2 family nucleobase:cation symporter-2